MTCEAVSALCGALCLLRETFSCFSALYDEQPHYPAAFCGAKRYLDQHFDDMCVCVC